MPIVSPSSLLFPFLSPTLPLSLFLLNYCRHKQPQLPTRQIRTEYSRCPNTLDDVHLVKITTTTNIITTKNNCSYTCSYKLKILIQFQTSQHRQHTMDQQNNSHQPFGWKRLQLCTFRAVLSPAARRISMRPANALTESAALSVLKAFSPSTAEDDAHAAATLAVPTLSPLNHRRLLLQVPCSRTYIISNSLSSRFRACIRCHFARTIWKISKDGILVRSRFVPNFECVYQSYDIWPHILSFLIFA
jgi:hypothetical protein